MTRHVLSLVLLISCAHAMVHVYELLLPSVEQQIAGEFFAGEPAAGKAMTGRLSHAWRMMWGFGAIAAGWLVDRFGARRLLALYLVGCAGSCVAASVSVDQSSLLMAMLLMGGLASIYHPAGLALISHETDSTTRPMALGIHGVFGSGGIGLGPLAAGTLLWLGGTWRQVFAAFALPGLLLGGVFIWQAWRKRAATSPGQTRPRDDADHDQVDWVSFVNLISLGMAQGFIYSALLSFLPRYLSRVELTSSADDGGNFLTAAVLFVGCVGQMLAGVFARPALLERQLALILFANAPFLLWMAVAQGWDRVFAAGLLALVHFMHQPIYNSLIAKYTPRRHRSLCYGLSFAVGLGLGSFGALFAGAYQSDKFVYTTLAVIAGVGGVVCLGLIARTRNG